MVGAVVVVFMHNIPYKWFQVFPVFLLPLSSMKPYAEFNGSYGSFHTHKETVTVGTGLINNHWSFDARLSNKMCIRDSPHP